MSLNWLYWIVLEIIIFKGIFGFLYLQKSKLHIIKIIILKLNHTTITIYIIC